MKKLTFILAILITTIGCEDVIDVEVPNGEARLVIDATFEYFRNETPATMEGGVKLTLSAPFFNTDVPAVSDATVFLTNMNDNTIINFIESEEQGFFIPSEEEFLPEFDTPYQLTVEYKDETYVADATLIPTVPIDDVQQGDATLFDGDETEIIITYTDDATRDDFYLFDFDFNLFITSEDRFYQGKTFGFSYFYDQMVSNQEITIKIIGIDEQYFDYATLLIEQSDQGGGNPFQAPPAVLRGNIINKTSPDNYALGYFTISEASKFDFSIEK
ncbi:DUF4249 family protein [Aquimarina sp. 2201CG1-2-11]|uniref:DUF4249 family protein n=1 Tax=Aquimarina discodermiae TaxID=3231043 RepID=UPI00346370FF